MKNRSKTLLVKGIIGSSLLLSMGGVFAHTSGSIGHVHQAVPLSLTSTIILGILLIFTGLFILPRMQGRHIRTLATTTLLAGVVTAGVGGKLISDAHADLYSSSICVIDPDLTTTEACESVGGSDLEIHNTGGPIKLTFLDTPHFTASHDGGNLQIVKLTKGPINKQAILVSEEPDLDNCTIESITDLGITFILGAGEQCIFDHFDQHPK